MNAATVRASAWSRRGFWVIGLLLPLLLLSMLLLAADQRVIDPAADADARHRVLLEQAQAQGRIPVIVRLDLEPSPASTDSAYPVWHQRLAATQNQVVQRLPDIAPSEQAARALKRFAQTPALALQADSDDLNALLQAPEVLEIIQDRTVAAAVTDELRWLGADVFGSFDGYTGRDQVIAILDTGIDQSHPALGGKVIAEVCYSSTVPTRNITSLCPDGAESSTAPDSALDCPDGISGCGHGTAVALAAAGDFGEHTGVARDAELIALQIFSRFGDPRDCDGQAPCVRAFVSDLIRALEHLYSLRDTHPIVVANLSLGEGRYPTPCDTDPSRPIIDRLRAAGIATVVASGNDGYRDALRAPACITPAISVGAATWQGTVSPHANNAEFLDLLAPSLHPDAAAPGTSLAAPLVSGAWAVLKQAWPEASVDEILELLKTTGQPVLDWTPTGAQITPRLRLDQAMAERLRWSDEVTLSSTEVHTEQDGAQLAHSAAAPTVLSTASTCTADHLTPSGTITDTQQFHACQTITTQPNFTVASTAVVTFRAGQRITLSPGFRVQAGGRFTAGIGSTQPGPWVPPPPDVPPPSPTR